MNIKGHKRYTDEDIIKEANLYLKHKTMRSVSILLKMPIATVGWHLKHRLKLVEPILYKSVSELAQINIKK